MDSLLRVSAAEAKTCPRRLILVSVGQCGWTGRKLIRQLVILQMLVFTSEGCSKSQPYDASTSREGLSEGTSTTAALPTHTSHPLPTNANHRQPCSTTETGLVGCLNGGSCFVIDLHNSSSTAAHCSCTSEWSGNRCEYKYIDPSERANIEAQKRLKRICIAVGTITVVIVFISLVSLALYKRKQIRRANSSTTSGNSTTRRNNPQTSDSLLKEKEKNQSLPV